MLGGGGQVHSSEGGWVEREIELNSSGPILGAQGWRVAASKGSPDQDYPFYLTVSAFCAKL